MATEPVFNIKEAEPVRLMVLLVLIHLGVTIAPAWIKNVIYQWGLLLPIGFENVPVSRQVTSLIGHGFLHAGWGHVLMNSGMILVFGVATLRGLRAYRTEHNRSLLSPWMFYLIFILGVMVGGLWQWGWWSIIDIKTASALGASGGASALFATAGWAIGGRKSLIEFGLVWVLINVLMVVFENIIGVSVAWPAHIGGYVLGALAAPYCIKPFSSGLSITR